MDRYIDFKRFILKAFFRYEISDEYFNGEFSDDNLYADEDKNVLIIQNDDLKYLYNEVNQSIDRNNNEIAFYKRDYCIIPYDTENNAPFNRRREDEEIITDDNNDIEYRFAILDDFYIVFLLIKLFDRYNNNLDSYFHLILHVMRLLKRPI